MWRTTLGKSIWGYNSRAINDDQRKALANLLRQHVQLIADLSLLYSILDSFANLGQPPIRWKQMMGEMQKSEQYRKMVQEFEPLISKLERPESERDLIELLRKISGGKLPN